MAENEGEISPQIETQVEIKKPRVLLVDNEQEVHDTWALPFKRLKLSNPEHAYNEDQALDMYERSLGEEHPLDIIISDLEMDTERSGISLAEKVREIESDKDHRATVILSSGRLKAEAIERAGGEDQFNSLFDGFIQKGSATMLPDFISVYDSVSSKKK